MSQKALRGKALSEVPPPRGRIFRKFFFKKQTGLSSSGKIGLTSCFSSSFARIGY